MLANHLPPKLWTNVENWGGNDGDARAFIIYSLPESEGLTRFKANEKLRLQASKVSKKRRFA